MLKPSRLNVARETLRGTVIVFDSWFMRVRTLSTSGLWLIAMPAWTAGFDGAARAKRVCT